MSEPGIGAQRADTAGFGEQPVPGVTTAVDDVLGGAKDAVRQAIVAPMQPQPLDRIEFGRVGRQEHQAEIFGHHQIAGGMPTRLVHQHDAMRPGSHGLREFNEEQVHRRSVEPGQHQCDAKVARRADGADNPGRLIADIAASARGMAALPPNITGASLLPDPGLVLAPDLKPLGLGMRRGNLVQASSKAPFLKACCAFSSLCGWRGRVLRWLRSRDHNRRSIPVSL